MDPQGGDSVETLGVLAAIQTFGQNPVAVSPTFCVYIYPMALSELKPGDPHWYMHNQGTIIVYRNLPFLVNPNYQV